MTYVVNEVVILGLRLIRGLNLEAIAGLATLPLLHLLRPEVVISLRSRSVISLWWTQPLVVELQDLARL